MISKEKWERVQTKNEVEVKKSWTGTMRKNDGEEDEKIKMLLEEVESY